MSRIHMLLVILVGVIALGVLSLARNVGISDREILFGLLIGLFSGLTTSLVLLVLRYVIRGGLNPWVENLLYRDAHVEGTWIGALIPYYGVEELDKMVKNKTMEAIFKIRKQMRGQPSTKTEMYPIEASSVENGNQKKVDAQLILPDNEDEATTPKKKTISININISPIPIRVRLDLNRIGHRVFGKLTELGGASDIHTYTLEGEFRNLIASGC